MNIIMAATDLLRVQQLFWNTPPPSPVPVRLPVIQTRPCDRSGSKGPVSRWRRKKAGEVVERNGMLKEEVATSTH